MKDPISSSNFGRFTDIAKLVTPLPKETPSLDEIITNIYFFKIIGMLWFEGSIPVNPNTKFEYYINLNWPSEDPPEGMEGISTLKAPAMKWITKKFSKPDWVKKGGPKVKLSLSDCSLYFSGIVQNGFPKNF
jgi:hypothetical protein